MRLSLVRKPGGIADAMGTQGDRSSSEPLGSQTTIYGPPGCELGKPKASPCEQIWQVGLSDGDQVIVVRSRNIGRRPLESSRPEMKELKPMIDQPVIQLRTRGAGTPKVELRIFYVEAAAIGNGLPGARDKSDFEPFDVDLQQIHRPISDDGIESANWNPERRAAGRRRSACEIHVVAAKVRENDLSIRTADGRIVDLNRQPVQANVAQQVFADARMCLDSNDSPRSCNPRGGGEAQLSDVRANIDEGLSSLQVGSHEIGIISAKVPLAPKSGRH